MPFDVIYADPPWRYLDAKPNRRIENHYPTMALTEIQGLEIDAAANSVLFMWATAPKLAEAITVIDAWGFEYKTCAVWDKVLIGMGYWFRGRHELLLVATRGKVATPKVPLRRPSIWRIRRTSHSTKPDQFREWIEHYWPGARRLEMFARVRRAGWVPFGNQIESDLFTMVACEADEVEGGKFCHPDPKGGGSNDAEMGEESRSG